MVHALREAHRVLRPDGIVADLRPAAKHRRVGVGIGRRWRLVGVMRESFDKDRAADRAVSAVVKAGIFRRGVRAEFLVDREMDRLEDFRAWLKDFDERRSLKSHEWLIARLKRARAAKETAIVARGFVTLQILHPMKGARGPD